MTSSHSLRTSMKALMDSMLDICSILSADVSFRTRLADGVIMSSLSILISLSEKEADI